MKIGQYPTGGDVHCFINGWWIDDLARIEYAEDNPKIPLRSYHQKDFSDVADGKYIITGSMALHFRAPGYLLRAIHDEAAASTPYGLVKGAEYTTGRRIQALQIVKELRSLSPVERAKYLSRLSPYTLNAVSPLLNQIIFEAIPDPSDSAVHLGPHDMWGGAGGCDILVTYGSSGGKGGTWTETLQGVHFTSVNKTVSNLAGGGDSSGSGQSILEVYSFFAKKKVVEFPDRAHQGLVAPSSYVIDSWKENKLSALLDEELEGL